VGLFKDIAISPMAVGLPCAAPLAYTVNDNVLYHAQYWLLRTAPHAPMSGSNGAAPTPASSSSPNSLPNIPEALASEFPAWQSQFSIEF
jgi:hypothetical protein